MFFIVAVGASCGGEDAPPGPPDGGGPDGGVDGPSSEVGELPAPRVAISELMYHPVGANLDDDNHEFVELHNPGTVPVELAGWKLSGDIAYTFAAGASLAPGQFLVVAKNRVKLLAVAKYALGPLAGQVLGDYTGALDDGGGRVVLTDAAGGAVDAVHYDDEFPWPLAADALGAGDSWFEETQWFPATDPRRTPALHRYMGHSLERVSFAVASAQVANWVASPLDGATPGKANSVTGTPPAIVEQLTVGPQSAPDSKVIGPVAPVLVRAQVTAGSPIVNLKVEYYVEFDRGRKVTPTPASQKIAMTAVNGGWEAVLPGQPARSVVRYRIVGERAPGSGTVEVLAPRPTDPVPYGHHAYFVSQPMSGKPQYEILVSPENWGRMWTNVSPDGAVIGCPADYVDEPCSMCTENPNWNARVPAIFVFGGEAFDARTRYQGSLEGRLNTEAITGWPDTLPKPAMGPLEAMSWSIAFPRYHQFEGLSRVVLNRLNQSCPGLSHVIAAALDEDPRGGRIPAPRVRRWARLFVNGGPYNYVMDLEQIGEDYLERFHGKGQPIGDVYKIFSTGDDLGPWAAGFGQVIQPSPHCPEIPVRTRYEHTYKRESHDWRSIDDMMALILSFSGARDTADPMRVREFLQRTFDVDKTLKYYAVQQWGAPWDDNGKNYNIYKLPAQDVKPGGGAYTITSWDVDRMFGVGFCPSDTECARADISIYCDDMNIPRCNRWKRAFMDTMKAEYDAKLKELNETLFLPANIARIADEGFAGYDGDEAHEMLGPVLCEGALELANAKRFAQRRYLAVRKQLGY